jgi:putative endonuclease
VSEAIQNWKKREKNRISPFGFLFHIAFSMTNGYACFPHVRREKDMERQGYVYILFNRRNGTLYTGVTSHLARRMHEHKQKLVDGFTKRYGVDKLGYYETHDRVVDAIEREKQIKAGSRKKKLELIESMNPDWRDLYEDLA